MKIDRMIGILSVLLQKGKVTAPYLAERFEVSRRTINRDIEALCMAGIPLKTSQGPKGGISIMDGYRIPYTLLTTMEMQAILAGLRSLDSVSGTGRYAQLMEKLSPGASGLLAGGPNILIDLSSWYKESLSPKIELIQQAIQNNKMISFTYYAPKGESSRDIEPYILVFQWASWYVWGWCLARQDFRLFKLNRIADLKMGKPFEKRQVPMPDFSLERVFPPSYFVKALIQPEYKWRLIEEYGPDCFTEQPDGSLLFGLPFPDKNGIIQWIVSFGSGAELLEPAELREEIAEFAQTIYKRYRNSK